MQVLNPISAQTAAHPLHLTPHSAQTAENKSKKTNTISFFYLKFLTTYLHIQNTFIFKHTL